MSILISRRDIWMELLFERVKVLSNDIFENERIPFNMYLWTSSAINDRDNSVITEYYCNLGYKEFLPQHEQIRNRFKTRNNYYNERLRNWRIVATRGYLKKNLIIFLYFL